LLRGEQKCLRELSAGCERLARLCGQPRSQTSVLPHPLGARIAQNLSARWLSRSQTSVLLHPPVLELNKNRQDIRHLGYVEATKNAHAKENIGANFFTSQSLAYFRRDGSRRWRASGPPTLHRVHAKVSCSSRCRRLVQISAFLRTEQKSSARAA